MQGYALSPAVSNLLAHFPNAKRSGHGWVAKCPCHDDKNASLSVGQGEEGRALLNCFAGCPTENILAAIGLKPSDLFCESSSDSPNGHDVPAKSPKSLSEYRTVRLQASVVQVEESDLRSARRCLCPTE